MKKVPVDENLLIKDILFQENVRKEIENFFARTSSKQENNKNNGFKFYAVGREEWKLNHDQVKFMRSMQEG